MSLFITKSVDALTAGAAGEGKLKRVLGPVDLTMLGIGAIIGTGIFVLTGQAAAAHAGPAIVLSMIARGHRQRAWRHFATPSLPLRCRLPVQRIPTVTRRLESSSRGSSAGT